MTYRRSAVNSAIVPAEPNGVSAQYVAFVHCVLAILTSILSSDPATASIMNRYQ